MVSWRMWGIAAPLLAGLAAGCSSPQAGALDGPVPDRRTPGERALAEGPTRETSAADQRAVDAPPPSCPQGATECVDKNTERRCEGAPPRWQLSTCAQGALCLGVRCSTECSDECNLGATRTTGGKTETCSPYSVKLDAAVILGSGLHDRARQYNAWLRKHHLPGGTVADVLFTSTAYGAIAAYDGTGDSAIWTGSYLAAEALRLMQTGSPDAAANVEALVEAIHRLFEITGAPGFLARFAAPLGVNPLYDADFDPKSETQHKVSYGGKDYFWKGSTSRDQYQGVLLGYALAYEALSSAKHRQLIRDDMVTLATELIKERKAVPVTLRLKVSGNWIELPFTYDLQHVVLNPSEYKNGTPFIRIGDEQNGTSYEETQIYGIREFLPDYSTMLKQTPLIGSLIPSIPRSGSAIMLAAILRIAMLTTKNEPAYAATYAAIKSHYDAKASWLLDLMRKYAYLNAGAGCWKAYYGLNIDFEPIYSLVRLEDDPTRRTAYQQEILEGKMWPVVKDHKNVFFSFIHASQAPPSSTIQGVVAVAQQQLAQFPPPPHAHVAVDNTATYPANPQCPGQSTVAVDVKERVASDFIWQREPFSLVTAGHPEKVYPGVDYLLAYWLGRKHGFLDDDAKGTCLRWQ